METFKELNVPFNLYALQIKLKIELQRLKQKTSPEN